MRNGDNGRGNYARSRGHPGPVPLPPPPPPPRNIALVQRAVAAHGSAAPPYAISRSNRLLRVNSGSKLERSTVGQRQPAETTTIFVAQLYVSAALAVGPVTVSVRLAVCHKSVFFGIEAFFQLSYTGLLWKFGFLQN